MMNAPSLGQHMAQAAAQPRALTCEGAATPYTGSAAMATALRKKYPAGCASILIGTMPSNAYGKAPGSQGRAAIHLGLGATAVRNLQMTGVNGPDIQNLKKALASNGRIGIAQRDGNALFYGTAGPW